jgi:hypothetical protein
VWGDEVEEFGGSGTVKIVDFLKREGSVGVAGGRGTVKIADFLKREGPEAKTSVPQPVLLTKIRKSTVPSR